MCGIAGIFTLDPQRINVAGHLLRMSEKLRHRGPDDEGFYLWSEASAAYFSGADTPAEVKQSQVQYTSPEVLTEMQAGFSLGLCHRRLSILDLSPRGHQPMTDESGRIHITFNGEIYNFIELRAELEQAGYIFRTGSDTEVLIAAYKAWGEKCLSRLNGMWSFVLFDEERKELFAARDRFGVKPFYYYHDSRNFCFASEQKAIAGLPFVNTGINRQAVYDFLVNHEMEYAPDGFFMNILELFPGNFLRFSIRTNTLSITEYASLNVNTAFSDFDATAFERLKAETETLLVDAVRLRMRSDVKVGSCLSGGIDSSVIGGIMQHLLRKKDEPEFFTAVFPGTGIDEAKWAKEVAGNGGHWNTTTPTAEELWKDLDNLVYSQDIPIWSSSTYAQFRVMRLAKEKGIKVLLDGQGGDELFAGYIPYYLSFWNELKLNGRTKLLKQEMDAFRHSSARKFSIRENIKEKIEHSSSGFFKMLKDPQLRVLNADFMRAYARPPRLHKKYDSLNAHLRAEFCNTRLKLYLKCEDRCSMWHSVESRTPFADDAPLIEKIFSVPAVYKIRNGTLKFLLREAAGKFLPEKIYSRSDKMGYVTPHNTWMRQLWDQHLAEEDFSPVKEYLDAKQFTKKKRGFYNPIGDQERFLGFKILVFNRWKRLFGL